MWLRASFGGDVGREVPGAQNVVWVMLSEGETNGASALRTTLEIFQGNRPNSLRGFIKISVILN